MDVSLEVEMGGIQNDWNAEQRRHLGIVGKGKTASSGIRRSSSMWGGADYTGKEGNHKREMVKSEITCHAGSVAEGESSKQR